MSVVPVMTTLGALSSPDLANSIPAEVIMPLKDDSPLESAFLMSDESIRAQVREALCSKDEDLVARLSTALFNTPLPRPLCLYVFFI